MDQTYMKEKPVVPLLLSMGIPVIISMIAGALYNIVDSIFVAMISEDAMTAVSLVYPIQNLAHAAGVGFGVGINAMVARRLGEGKTRMANQTASQGVFLSALHGMILTILGMAVIPYFLRMFTSDEVTISYGLTYFCNVFLFSTIDTMGMAYEKVYQSVGKMKISMAAVLIGCGVNIVLDPIFIFGLGPMPELGIRGAAWATDRADGVAAVLFDFKPCETVKCGDFAAGNASVEGDLRRYVFSRNRGNTQYGADIPAFDGTQCDSGTIFTGIYSGVGRLL